MKKPTQADTVVIKDRGGRRRFIRAGGAMLLTGAAVATTGNALAGDCDNGATLGSAEKNPEQAGSDSDTGANADPNGCGRRGKKPKMTGVDPADRKNLRASVPVTKIKA